MWKSQIKKLEKKIGIVVELKGESLSGKLFVIDGIHRSIVEELDNGGTKEVQQLNRSEIKLSPPVLLTGVRWSVQEGMSISWHS